jgi:IS30 family transposase
MTTRIRTLPTERRRSVTWDQGNEMALHREFTIATGMQVYFCDPSSSWQRDSNENTNGLLSSACEWTERSVLRAARQLNRRPRETLGWMTPLEKTREVGATTP